MHVQKQVQHRVIKQVTDTRPQVGLLAVPLKPLRGLLITDPPPTPEEAPSLHFSL